MFNVSEIKSWAKNHGFVVKKQADGYVWSNSDSSSENPESIDFVAISIFNKITNNKFLEHQKNYKKKNFEGEWKQ